MGEGVRCRVLTWNLWWRLGPWQARQPAIEAVLAAEQPDVLAVQECWAAPDGCQLDRLASVTGLPHTVYSPVTRPQLWRSRLPDGGPGVDFGVGVASRWPIVRARTIVLPAGDGPDGGRTALGVVLAHPDGPFPFVTTHLTSHPTDSATRLAQLDAVSALAWEIRELAHALPPGAGSALPVVVTGDLNSHPDSDPIRRFAGVLTAPVIPRFGFVDCWELRHPQDPGHTWVNRNQHVVDWSPQARIDYVFIGIDDLGRRGMVGEAALVGDGPVGGIWPSDHLGVRVDLEPVPPAGVSS